MSTVSVLIITGFKKTAEKVVAFLSREIYQSIFLDFPTDLTVFVRDYMEDELNQEELWRNYGYLTGLQEPFVNALRYRIDPILDFLPRLRYRIPGLKIYCYQDLECHLEDRKLSERLLLLETGERVRRDIRIGEWRELLRDEVELSVERLTSIVENISEEAEKHSRNTVLYGGFIKPLKDCMEAKGFMVEPIYCQFYWRSPIDVLRTIISVKGVDAIPDEVILRCVKGQLKYLDYVLLSEDIDVAHEKWTSETQPNVPIKETNKVLKKDKKTRDRIIGYLKT